MILSLEEKIITLIKSKIKMEVKNISIKEAEKIISEFNKSDVKDLTRNKQLHNIVWKTIQIKIMS